jgi:hypothetical protein
MSTWEAEATSSTHYPQDTQNQTTDAIPQKNQTHDVELISKDAFRNLMINKGSKS